MLAESQIVQVTFPLSSTPYNYLAPRGHEVGDQVVVNSPFSGMTIVPVVGVRDITKEEIISGLTGFKYISGLVNSIDAETMAKSVQADAERVTEALASVKQFASEALIEAMLWWVPQDFENAVDTLARNRLTITDVFRDVS